MNIIPIVTIEEDMSTQRSCWCARTNSGRGFLTVPPSAAELYYIEGRELKDRQERRKGGGFESDIRSRWRGLRRLPDQLRGVAGRGKAKTRRIVDIDQTVPEVCLVWGTSAVTEDKEGKEDKKEI